MEIINLRLERDMDRWGHALFFVCLARGGGGGEGVGGAHIALSHIFT